MSDLDLEPLVRGDGDPLERTVLESARVDGPSPATRAALLAALAPAPLPSATAAPSPTLLRRLDGRVAPGIAIVIGVGAAAVMSVIGGDPGRVPASSSVAPVVVTEPTAEPSQVAELRATAPATPDEAPVRPSPEATPLKRAPRRAPVTDDPPRAPSAAPAETTSDSTLGRELARVGAARSALAAADPSQALSLLDAYDAEFPGGAFSVEVSVLRIDALARSGRTDEARRLGDRFLAQHPRGAFARRVTATLRSIDPSSQDSTLASPRD